MRKNRQTDLHKKIDRQDEASSRFRECAKAPVTYQTPQFLRLKRH